jgi:hypothetical protein
LESIRYSFDKPIKTKRGRTGLALYSARVLAEFGDSSGFELAAKTAIESQFASHRDDAIRALAELTKIDKSQLEKRGVFPEQILLDIAEIEKDSHTIDVLFTNALSVMSSDSGIKVLRKMQDSPYLSEIQKRMAKSGIEQIMKRLEEEKQFKAEENNTD